MNWRHVVITGMLFVFGLLTLGVLLLSCSQKGAEQADQVSELKKEVDYYTCGMHPSVKTHEPGKCPICNMDLVPVYKEGEAREHDLADHTDESEVSHWICEMHPSVKAHAPGVCPICDMELVPVDRQGKTIKSTPARGEREKELLYWTCGMHPSVKTDAPGKCPLCNMDLVPVYREAQFEGEEDIPTLKASQKAQALAGIETAEVSYRQLHKEIQTVGNIAFDERSVARVTAWISGRIDRLFVDFTGKEIRQGEPLALIYSPELVSTQEEYILSLETLDKLRARGRPKVIENAEQLVASSKKRLLLWGIPEKEIVRLERERVASEHVKITSPIGGTVVEKAALEGQYIKEGQILFTIADLSNLWMLADVYEQEMGWIQFDQRLNITSPAYPGELFEGKVAFIDPVLHEQTRSVKVRAHIPNPEGRLKPGMFVNVTFDIHLTEDLFPGIAGTFDGHGGVLSVPASSVLQTGTRTIVYQEVSAGEYAGQEVHIGPRAGVYYPLLAGLDEGSRVVTNGNFLLDSQSKLTGLEAAVYDAALGEKKAMPGHQH